MFLQGIAEHVESEIEVCGMARGEGYLEKIEELTGNKPSYYVDLAKEKGFTAPGTRPGVVIDWLKKDMGLGHGHAMAMAHFITTGERPGE